MLIGVSLNNNNNYYYYYSNNNTYLSRGQESLNELGLILSAFNNYKHSGRSMHGEPDSLCKNNFGANVELPDLKPACLCGHRIVEQCYTCPEGSSNPDDIIVVGNRCITKWGVVPAIRGNGNEIMCEHCGVTINKYGLRRHQTTNKCKHNRDTSSNMYTSVGYDVQW